QLALQWPPSVYSSTLSCKTPIPTVFTIRGIWAQDAHDRPVPPYNARNPCTHPQPETINSLEPVAHTIAGLEIDRVKHSVLA
ncbi:hypothetical protein Gogos_020914, partial [Gossypium gossypioides]|nr:hypothetical protein [Gossypium gossypioides]